MTIIVEHYLDHWTAWVAATPCFAYGGATAA